MTFYKCESCGNLVELINDSGIPMMCCGEDMTELIPGMSDGDGEKHVPVYAIEDKKLIVTVGLKEHPMTDAHYIEWIAVETNKGIQRKALKPGKKPCKKFLLMEGEKVLSIYAYCNIHGLWKADCSKF